MVHRVYIFGCCMKLCGTNRRKLLEIPCSTNANLLVSGHLKVGSYKNVFLVVLDFMHRTQLCRGSGDRADWFAPRFAPIGPLRDLSRHLTSSLARLSTPRSQKRDLHFRGSLDRFAWQLWRYTEAIDEKNRKNVTRVERCKDFC